MKQRSTAAAAGAGECASVWPRRALRYGLPALAAALTTAGPNPASAGGGAGPPAPAANHIWAGCRLSDDAVLEIEDDIIESSGGEFSPFGGLEVAFIVVYSLQENDGQPLAESGDTGPILCTGGIPFGEGGFATFEIETTTEASPIPEPSSGAESVNILDLEEALILRYEPNLEGGELGDPEKRFCHTVDDNTDCFTVFGPFFD